MKRIKSAQSNCLKTRTLDNLCEFPLKDLPCKTGIPLQHSGSGNQWAIGEFKCPNNVRTIRRLLIDSHLPLTMNIVTYVMKLSCLTYYYSFINFLTHSLSPFVQLIKSSVSKIKGVHWLKSKLIGGAL